MAAIVLPAAMATTTTTTSLISSSKSTLLSSSPVGAAASVRSSSSCRGWCVKDRSRGSSCIRWEEKSRGVGVVTEVFASLRIENSERRNSSAGTDELETKRIGVAREGLGFGVARIGQSRLENRGGTNNNAAVGAEVATGGDDIGSGGAGGSGGGSGGGDGDASGDEDGELEGSGNRQNREGAVAALAAVGRSVKSLPEYLASAVNEGKIPPVVLERFFDLEKSPVRNWLMQFGGFRERLLADDLFLTKVGIECGVGLFTKTAAEYERRRENFTKELDFVVADVIMALIADFMLVWLPAPTVALRPALATNAGAIAKYFASCPDNAFQVALRGTSYSTLQRLGAIGRNGAKLVVVGTSASLMGTAATNALIKLRQSGDSTGEAEDVPILATSLAYGVYMGVSSNLRYQVLAGVVEQRILEPMLGRRKLALSVSSFIARTGNTFLGSLLWVDYARWVGVQKIAE